MPEPFPLDRYREDLEANERQRRRVLEAAAGGGSGMDGRIDKLERDVADIKATLARLEPTLRSVNDDIKEIKGRVAAMPSTWQLIGLTIGIFAAAAAVVRFVIR